MKKFIIATSALYFICISCNTAPDKNTAQEQNRQTTRDILKDLQSGDASKVPIASDAVDHNAGPAGRDIKGDSIRWYLADMHNHFSDLKVELINDAADGDYVYCWSKMSGTAKDASMGMPAGTKIDSKGVDVVKFKDGKVVEHWGYMDANDLMKMMQQPATMPTAATDMGTIKSDAKK